MFGAKHGSTADQPCVLGVPKLVETEEAKIKQGAERIMTSWHKGEEEASRRRAIKLGGNGPKTSPDKTPTNETGGGRVATTQEECKREEADRVAR